MSKPAFTPGPWSIETPLGGDAYSIVQSGLQAYEWQFIAHIPVGTPAEGKMPRYEARANSRLIAAVPDMVEALQSAVASFEQFVRLNRIPENTAGLRDARSALARALGELSLPAAAE